MTTTKNSAKIGKFRGEADSREAPVFNGNLVVGSVARLVESENVSLVGGNARYRHTVTGYAVELFDGTEARVRTRGEALAVIRSADLSGIGRAPNPWELSHK